MVPLPTVDVLDSITIPVPCPVSWDEMAGDARTRFCGRCGQNVHDVSEMTTAEAVQLLTQGEKPPCLRIYKRQDDRVMTADCATKRERVWKWLHRRSAWAAALFAVIFFVGCETRGVPCRPDKEESLPGHLGEHGARSKGAADHTDSASGMEAEAKAEAPVRHESATER